MSPPMDMGILSLYALMIIAVAGFALLKLTSRGRPRAMFQLAFAGIAPFAPSKFDVTKIGRALLHRYRNLGVHARSHPLFGNILAMTAETLDRPTTNISPHRRFTMVVRAPNGITLDLTNCSTDHTGSPSTAPRARPTVADCDNTGLASDAGTRA